jgi:predicted solute-binding protein
MPKRLGVLPHSFARPLYHGLRKQQTPSPVSFELVEDQSTQLAIQLRQGNLDGAFLSPIEYAKEYAHYSLVPDAGVVAEGESGIALLLFRENLSRIKTISVHAGSSSEIVLAHLVMAEKYDTVPQFVPMTASPDIALKSSDAVLLVGDAAVGLDVQKQKIDLVDEWTDITGLPFVHGVWAFHPESLSNNEVQALIESGKAADAYGPPSEYLNLHFQLSPHDIEALSEFFRMSYYHGIINDIPDLRFFSTESKVSFGTNN